MVHELSAATEAAVRAAFADAFIAQSGIDRGWRDVVAAELRVRPLQNSLFLVFGGMTATREWDGTEDAALGIVSSCMDRFVEDWRSSGHERGPHRWDIAPGTHEAHGCRCERVQALNDDDAAEYVENHLIRVREEGTAQQGRALLHCPYVPFGWAYTWGNGGRRLEQLPPKD